MGAVVGGDTIVLIGPHGVGKTTHGRWLATQLEGVFHAEIGRRLREEALAANPNAHAMSNVRSFDACVFEQERRRDARWPFDRASFRVVETWHLGNAAYALQRDLHTARRMLAHLRELSAPQRDAVLVVPLRMRRSTSVARLSEPGPSPDELVHFFRGVSEDAERLAALLGFRMTAPVWSDGPVEHTRTALLAAVRAVATTAPSSGELSASDAGRV